VLEYQQESIIMQPYPAWARVRDFIGALLAVILFAPIMFAVAIAVKVSSPGPVLFRQRRGGHGGEPFTLYKFRSMIEDAEERKAELQHFNERTGPVFKMKHDPRVTRVGRFIRAASLDEFPQLFNVLKGEMSLVGPRPLPVTEEKGYDQWHQRRLEVMPGITCIWQVTCRDESDFDHWARLDIEYVENHGFFLDLWLILLTIPAVLLRKGAH